MGLGSPDGVELVGDFRAAGVNRVEDRRKNFL